MSCSIRASVSIGISMCARHSIGVRSSLCRSMGINPSTHHTMSEVGPECKKASDITVSSFSSRFQVVSPKPRLVEVQATRWRRPLCWTSRNFFRTLSSGAPGAFDSFSLGWPSGSEAHFLFRSSCKKLGLFRAASGPFSCGGGKAERNT